jgi:hypothetical protein
MPEEALMNAVDVLTYGHLTLLRTLDGLPEPAWRTGGVCGWWSVKDIVAHLTSFEVALVDILQSLRGGGATPQLDEMLALDPEEFNRVQVERRTHRSVEEVLSELSDAHAQVMERIAMLPIERRREAGALPWYGLEYDLDDLISYQYYGHKREHSAQIAVYRDQLA